MSPCEKSTSRGVVCDVNSRTVEHWETESYQWQMPAFAVGGGRGDVVSIDRSSQEVPERVTTGRLNRFLSLGGCSALRRRVLASVVVNSSLHRALGISDGSTGVVGLLGPV
ncbi:hypothetical protein OIU84_006449 [Salix udensis]|uniref:Uncharacterized protein n=1 Tax=Salix udensis TaxID=889485 RepID=A0AAD6K073_9ROSI|nr:hypothetical protein OIU84_006449 [Salix udensis]